MVVAVLAGGIRITAHEPAVPLDAPVLVTQIPAGQLSAAAAERPVSPLGLIGEGGRIVMVQPEGEQRVLTEGFHSAADPSVSFDAQRCLFSAKRTADEPWNVYELTFADGQVRQLTRDFGNCRQPSYQSNLFTVDSPAPWFQLTFVSDAGGWLREDGSGVVSSLYSCRLDGSQIRRLTYNLSDDADPFLMGDGRLLYASWQRAGLSRGPLGRVALFAINIEGTDNALFGDTAGKRFKRMPCVTDRGAVLFIEGEAAAADGAGQVGMVTFRRPLHSYRALTAAEAGYVYRCPAPWTAGQALISRRPLDGSASWGVFVMDPKEAACQPIFDDPAFDEVQAVAVRTRRQPDGRSTVVDDEKPSAKIYCLNLYQHDMPDASWWPVGLVTRVRLLEGVPMQDGAAGTPPVGESGGLPVLAQRRLLGETDISPDGSFHISIPANTPVELQALDRDGLALRSCSWIWSKNLEARGCIGCHEDGESTPQNMFVEALKRPAVELTLPPERRRTVDFRRDIMPILEKKCVVCHGPDGDPPRLDGGLEPMSPPGGVNRAYASLMAVADATGSDTGCGLYVHRGRARTSPLIWHLLGRNTARPWDGDVLTGRAAKPIPAGQTPGLTKVELRLFVEWVDMGAAWDGIPGPDEWTAGSPASGTAR